MIPRPRINPPTPPRRRNGIPTSNRAEAYGYPAYAVEIQASARTQPPPPRPAPITIRRVTKKTQR